MNTSQKNFNGSNRGAVFLIAMLVASVALAIGIGVYHRTYKELLFASFWKQAQTAFAAADAGLECALYWDWHPASATCFGSAITAWIPGSAGSFDANVGTGCVHVDITKAGTPVVTTIQSYGYNTCDPASLRRVERGLRIDY
ncbi:MAG: hypothetical protein HZB12_01600 [Candidatus Yonathbacteria bacterium]|nr:hypothetical protein [Candidatus Yonathbacteria bacterium]